LRRNDHMRRSLDLHGRIPRHTARSGLETKRANEAPGESGILGDLGRQFVGPGPTSASGSASQAIPIAAARSPVMVSPNRASPEAASRPAARFRSVKWPPPGCMPIWGRG